MTAVNLSIRIPDAENPGKKPIIISAKSDEGGTPVLAMGAFGQLQELAQQAVEDALAAALSDASAAEQKAEKAAGAPDAGEAPAPKEETKQAGDTSADPQLTLLSFDF